MATKNLVPTATTLFLLLLTLTTADTASDLVRDVEGKPLKVGSEYYIRRAVGFFGGIGKSRRRGPCPLYVIEYQNPGHKGDPVKFVPVNKTQKEIHLSSNIKIDSGKSAICRSNGFWRVIFDAYNRRNVIIASGNSSDARTTFRIEKTQGPLNAYKIVYPLPTTPTRRSYLTVFRDRLSRLKLVGLTDNSARAVVFVFYKKKKDVSIIKPSPSASNAMAAGWRSSAPHRRQPSPKKSAQGIKECKTSILPPEDHSKKSDEIILGFEEFEDDKTSSDEVYALMASRICWRRC
ncbi:hypothetical protein Cgig2_024352 [Carnegiea gigantea]|uniref:Uncharacterized protein n=1 Tax=Carnegiea gigantea TaxID=171969 RepID=A0A9Q1K226_9CARY|nr:hypothetical protein Cgig2_024352 [Carnegiea gigantea]